MKFRNYCVVIMGDTKNVVIEIEKVAEGKVNVLDAKGVLIATFSSNIEPREMTDWFKLNKRSFLVFDLSPENSGFDILKTDIQDGLFSFIKDVNLEEKVKNLVNSIESSSKHNYKEFENVEMKNTNKELTEEDIQRMNTKEKKQMFDEILDKGADKLTENDKKLIPFLVK